ncbi:MAG: B12-binding domain-containing protein [Burkholderiales bacterium]
MQPHLTALPPEGLREFHELRRDAVDAVTARFFAEHGAAYAALGPRARDACREDLEFHLEFLRPVLEFGLLAPMVDYLHWLAGVLAARGVPATHLPLSLDWLAEFFAEHMDSAHAGAVVAALRAANQALRERPDAAPAAPPGPEPWPECAAFEEALLAGDRRRAAEVIEGVLAQDRGLVNAEIHVIQPALYRIGEKWQRNEVSVAQEHLATAIAQSVMTLGLTKTDPPPANGRKVLLACVEGNHHAVGLQMVADAFQMSGWEVQYLGANVPTEALARQVAAWKPHLVGLSISFAHQLPAVRKAIARLQDLLGTARPPVIVGGLAINRFDALTAQVGAEGSGGDALAAVASGMRLARGHT